MQEVGQLEPSAKAFIRWCPRKEFSFIRFQELLKESISRNQLTNGGPLQQKLSDILKAFTGSTGTILPACSGTGALHCLCAAHSIKAKRKLKWATQAFTFPPSIQGILSESIVVDMDQESFGISLTCLDTIRDEIDGVIVTNLFGTMSTNLCDVVSWCRSNGKLIVFDNAATPLGSVHSNSLQDLSDGSIISLHETKPLGRGEGGAIIIPETLHPFVYEAMNFGFQNDTTGGVCRVGNRYGSNFRCSDIAAAAIISHIENVENQKWINTMKRLKKHSVRLIEKYGHSLIGEPTDLLPCLAVRMEGLEEINISDVLHHLQSGTLCIEAKQYYRPLASQKDCPHAWALFNSTICLPLHADMSEDQVTLMFEKLHSIFRHLLAISS